MTDSLGIQIVVMAGALALAIAFIFGLAPLAARIMSARLRAELAHGIQACRDNQTEALTPSVPHPLLVRVAHLTLGGIWLMASVIAWLYLGVSTWPYAGFYCRC